MPRLRCPKCGAEMNRHAEKLVHPESSAEARLMDAALGGLLEETHACPRCGNVESRRV
jgi:ribosomal protein S27AE